MRLRLLTVLPVPLAVAAVLLIAGLAPAGDQAFLLRIEGAAVKAIAAAGAALAAFAFAPRSRLRPAWAALAASYALLAAKTCPVIGDDILVERLGTLLANLLAPVGSFLMVRAWYTSGLAPAIPALPRRILPVVAFAAALAVAGPGVVVELRDMGHDPVAVLLVFSGIGDIASITLLAPILLIARAMRGGRLAWPWALLAAGDVCWLLYDLVPFLSPELASSAAVARALSEVARSSACLFHASAGLAQLLVLAPWHSSDPQRAAA